MAYIPLPDLQLTDQESDSFTLPSCSCDTTHWDTELNDSEQEDAEFEQVLVMDRKTSHSAKIDKMDSGGNGLDKEDYYVRLYTLAPFLFGFTNLDDKWIKLLRESGLLCTKKREESIEQMSERELKIVDLVDATLTVVFTHWGKYNGKYNSDKETKMLTMYDQWDCRELTYKTILQEAAKHDTFTDLWKKFNPEFKQSDLYKFTLVYVLKQYYTLVKTSSDLVRETAKRFSQEVKLAEKWKGQGNRDFKEGKYGDAVKNYTKAIELCHFSNVLYGNRAQAYLNLKKYWEAMSDAKRAVAIKPEWVKGQYRYAQACVELRMFDAAEEANVIGQRVAHSSPKDDDLKDLLQQQLRIKDEKSKPFEEYDSEGVPDLVSSEDDDNDDDYQGSPYQEQEELKATEAERAEYQRTFTSWMRDGSMALLSKKSREAARCYQEALDLLAKHGLQYLDFDEIAEVVLKYSYGMACVDTAGYKLLRSGLKRLDSCVQSNMASKVPIVYHALGVIYVALYRFQEGRVQLSYGLNIVNTHGNQGVLKWPGTEYDIECTKQGQLKEALTELLRHCNYPPLPDGICRYAHSEEGERRQHLYFEDPEFKGLIRIVCWEQCKVDFHGCCWKRYKVTLGDRFTDRDMLDRRCPTNDCSSLIYKIVIYRPENLPDGKSITSDNKHIAESKSNKPTVKMVKASATKIQRKQEKLEKRKELRRVAAESNSGDENIESMLNVSEPKRSHAQMYNCVRDTVSDDRGRSTGVPENVTVLKKDEDEMDDKLKGKTKQRTKKKKSRTMLSMEISFNDRKEETLQGEHSVYEEESQGHGEEIPRFQRPQNPIRPFSVPDSLRAEIQDFEQTYRPSNGTDSSSKGSTESSGVLDQVSENLYSYFTDILQANGPQAIDDVALQQELEFFPEEAKKVISDAGGLRSFLLGSLKFRAVDDVLCLVRDLPKAKELAEERKFGLGMQIVRSRRANRTANLSINQSSKRNINLNPSAPEFTPSNVSNSYHVLKNNENPVHNLNTLDVNKLTSGANNTSGGRQTVHTETSSSVWSKSSYMSLEPQGTNSDMDGFTLDMSKNRKKGVGSGVDAVIVGNTDGKTNGKHSCMDLDIIEPLKIHKMFAEDDDTSSDTSSISRPTSARGVDVGHGESVDSSEKVDDAASTCSADSFSSESTKKHSGLKGFPKTTTFEHKPLTLPNPNTAASLFAKDFTCLNGLNNISVPDMNSIDDGSDEEVVDKNEAVAAAGWSNGEDNLKDTGDTNTEGLFPSSSSMNTSVLNTVSLPVSSLAVNSSSMDYLGAALSHTSSVWSEWSHSRVPESVQKGDSGQTVTSVAHLIGASKVSQADSFVEKDVKKSYFTKFTSPPFIGSPIATAGHNVTQVHSSVGYPPSLKMPTAISASLSQSSMTISPSVNPLSVMNMNPPSRPLVSSGTSIAFPVPGGPPPPLPSVLNSHLTDYMKQYYQCLPGAGSAPETDHTNNLYPTMVKAGNWNTSTWSIPPPSLVNRISDVNLTFSSGDPMGLSGFGPYKVSLPLNISESATQTEFVNCFEKAVNTDPLETFHKEYEAAKIQCELLEARLREAATHYTQLHETATQKLHELTTLINEVDSSRKSLETENESLKSRMETETRSWDQEKQGLHQQVLALQHDLHSAQVTTQRLEGEVKERDEERTQILQTVQQDRDKQMILTKEVINHMENQLTTQANRARNAETELLRVRLQSGMLVLERCVKEAKFHLVRLEGFAKKAREEKSSMPFPLKQAIDSWSSMIERCAQLIANSKTEFEEQIGKVQAGEELANLPPLRVPSPPPPPQMPMATRTPQGQLGGTDATDKGQSPQHMTNLVAQSEGPMGLGANVPLTLPHPLIPPMGLTRPVGVSTTGHPPPLRALVPPSGSISQRTPLKPLVPPMGMLGSRGPVSGVGNQQAPKNSFGKLIVMLQRMLPNYTRAHFTRLIQELRTSSGGSLSGMTLDQIVQEVADRIVEMENQMRGQPLSGVGTAGPGVGLRPPPGLSVDWSSGTMGMPVSASSELFEEEQDPCVICHEELTPGTAVTLECRHRFHEQCIKKWFNEQNTCPNCRTHALLPEDFPNLK